VEPLSVVSIGLACKYQAMLSMLVSGKTLQLI